MESIKKALLQAAGRHEEGAFSLACDIFEHPEIGGEEVYASTLLTGFLEEKGFMVERGIGGMETAFRATWERGSGGPSIGFLLEYDALRGMGHACGHHLQGPACINAALALMESCQEPLKLVLYGTPDEEIQGGKITMEKNGCFRDVDVMFSCHAGGKTGVSYKNRALAPTRVTFCGTPAHASGSPEKGRSALDAMMLAFHGLEILREHVKDGCRIHYTILEGTGASNIVHESARAHITLRSFDRRYLEDMVQRMNNVVKGACLMTDTTAEFEYRNVYWNLVPVERLNRLTLDTARELGAKKLQEEKETSGGSSDVGNVSWVVPTVLLYTWFSEAGSHTEAWMEEGKTENARDCMASAARIMALTALKLIKDRSLLEEIKRQHRLAVGAAE